MAISTHRPSGYRGPSASTSAPWLGMASSIAFTLLRIASGLMLVQHGVQKHFGWLWSAERPWGGAPDTFSQPWIAGTLEIAGGILLALGLFTRPVAFVLAWLMAFAYFLSHAPRGFWPIMNDGELRALYCFVFLAFAAIGGGPYSVDAMIGGRKRK